MCFDRRDGKMKILKSHEMRDDKKKQVKEFLRALQSYVANHLAVLALATVIITGWIGITLLKYSYAEPMSGDIRSIIDKCYEQEDSRGSELLVGSCVAQEINLDVLGSVDFASDDKDAYLRPYKPFLGFLLGLDIESKQKIELSEEFSQGLKVGLHNKYIEKGDSYLDQKQYKESIDSFGKAAELVQGVDMASVKLARAYLGIAQAYSRADEEDFDFPLSSALDFARKAESAHQSAGIMAEVGRFYLLNKNYAVAKQKEETAIEMARKDLESVNDADYSEDFRKMLIDDATTNLAEAHILMSLSCFQEIYDVYSEYYMSQIPSDLKACARDHYYKAKELDSENNRLNASMEEFVESF
jgi:tetratricopeptide (TPR) repeat protein